jgi:GNAT superfamily N-acetyltransferase
MPAAAPFVVRALELDLSPEDEQRRLHTAIAPAIGGPLPGEPPVSFDGWMAEERRFDASFDMVRFVAYDAEDDGIVGYGRVELDRDRNTHLAWAFGVVVDGRRRRGIGTELARHLVEVATDDGRVSFGANADEGSPGEAFVAGLGLTRRNTAHQNRLLLADLDVAQLHEWVARAGERAAAYSLHAWDGPTPADRIDAFAACTEVMNSAPRGDLELVDERMTPDRLRTIEGARAAAGTTWWTIGAIEDATGGFAGFTQLSFPPWRPTVARQNDTGVDPAHRERGLGRWLKAAMLLRVLGERPAIEQVETWNAGSNAPMLSINHALGFRRVRISGNWQADLDVVRKHLEERR